MNPDETTPEEPKTQRVSYADHVHDTARLVAEVSKRHRIPMGTAFNIVAWSIAHLEQRAEAAEREAAAIAALSQIPTPTEADAE